MRQRLAIGPVGGHGFVGVYNGEYAGAQRNLFALQAAGVAAAVVALVVSVDNLRGVAQEVDLVDDLVAQLRVTLHLHPIGVVQRSGLGEDGVGDTDLADIVEDRRLFDLAHLFLAQPHLPGHDGSDLGDAPGAALGYVVMQVQGGAEDGNN